MKFKLRRTGYFVKDKEHCDKLEKLGFRFNPLADKYHKYANADPKSYKVPDIEINTIEELVEFTREYGKIVFDGTEIEIYDDYRE